MVNIDQSQITTVSSCWTPIAPFTVNSVSQTNSIFTFPSGSQDQNLAITPFSASIQCGNYANTWLYSGADNSDGHSLNQSVDLMSVNPTTGAIFVSILKPVGTYSIKVTGILPDYVTTTTAIFTIIVTPAINYPPLFSSNLTNVTVPLKTSQSYVFPSITDQNTGDSPSISYVHDSATGSLPIFISITSTPSLTIYPTMMAQVGIFQMIVLLTDSKNTTDYTFQLTVTNLPPINISAPIQPFYVPFGQSTSYTLPTSIDPEGLIYTTSIISGGPSFASLISQTELNFNPVNCTTDFGMSTIWIKLEDEEPASTNYSISVQVTNSPPRFLPFSLTKNQIVEMNYTAYQPIPVCSDPEGCLLNQTIAPATLLSFVSLQSNQIQYSPTQQSQLGNHIVTLTCSDNQGLNISTNFTLTVYNPPQFAGNLEQQIDIMASNLANYSLPIMQGMFDEYVVHSPSLPSFIKFDFPLYSFYPDKKKYLGIQEISGKLHNSYTFIRFSFKINVYNEAPYLIDNLSNQVISLNTQQSYLIPGAVDKEGQSISYEAYELGNSVLPSFIKFSSETKEFFFSPTKYDQMRVYSIRLVLTDSFGANNFYTFKVALYDFSTLQSSNKDKSANQTYSNSTNSTLNWLNLIKNKNDTNTVILGMKIIKVSRNQKATIKIINPNKKRAQASDIVVLLSNQTFNINVFQKNLSYQVPYFIFEKDLANSIIQVNLIYPNASNLSVLLTPDILTVTTVNKIQTLKKQIHIILPENIESEANIPPQVTSKFEYTVIKMLQKGRITLTENTPINLIIGFIIQMVWIQLEDISFLACNSMLAIVIPGIPSIVQAVMIKYMYFDILYTEFWINQFMSSIGIDLDSVDDDNPLNDQFLENGFESKQFLKNSGSSVFLIGAFILGWFILSWLSFLSLCSSKINQIKKALMRQLLWNQSINFLISQFPPLFLCGLLNLYDIRFNFDQKLTAFSSYISVAILIAITLALLLLIQKVWQFTKTLNQNLIVTSLNQQYKALSDSLKETSRLKLIFFWKPLYLLRWALTLAILIGLQGAPSFQILSLLLISIIWQYFLLISSPFDSKAVNIISLYNEFSVSCYLYLAFLLSDYLETQLPENDELVALMRLRIAWILTCLLIFSIFINFAFTIIKIGSSFFNCIKRKVIDIRRQNSIELKYQMDQTLQFSGSLDHHQKLDKSDQTRVELGFLQEDMAGPYILHEKRQTKSKIQFPFEKSKAQIHDMFQLRE